MKKLKLLGLLIILSLLLFKTSYATQETLSAGSYGYNESAELIPLCGGEGQDDCIGTGATFEGSAIKECPAGSTFNLFTWGCHTCPDGYTLSAEGGFDPESDRACHKKTGRHTGIYSIPDESDFLITKTAPATTYGTVCPTGTFYDPIRDGECWSCPTGYDRNWLPTHIDSDQACILVGESKRAINHAYGTGLIGTDCPSGQFWDGWDGRCHSCPSGFNRTASHINSDRACSKAPDLSAIAKADTDEALAVFKAAIAPPASKADVKVALDTFITSFKTAADTFTGGAYYKPANLEKEDAVCDDGQKVDGLLDFEKGGTCYSCPETYRRTGAPVFNSDACDAPQSIDYQYATRVTDLTCPAGQDFDFINWQHERVISRTTGFDLDKNNTVGGTCWSCPDMSAGRSTAAVYEPDACVAPDIRWELPEWTSPGVYGRYANYAGEDVVYELITERTFLNTIIEQLWSADKKRSHSHKRFKGLSLAEMKAEMWEEILISPETSGVLRLALKSILVRTALDKTEGLPESSQNFLEDFEAAVTKYRTFLVEQSKKAFEIWDERAVERDVYKSNQTAGETLTKVFFVSIGMPWPPQSVPEFRSEAEQLTLDLQTTEAALKMAAISESLPSSYSNKILPVSYVKPTPKKDKQLAEAAADEARDYLVNKIQGASEKTIAKALKRLSLQTTALPSALSNPFAIIKPPASPSSSSAIIPTGTNRSFSVGVINTPRANPSSAHIPSSTKINPLSADVNIAPRAKTFSVDVKDTFRARAKEARANQARANQARANQARANQARANQARANQARANQARANQARANQARANQARANQARANQARANQARANQARANQAKANQAKANEARAKKAKANHDKELAKKNRVKEARVNKAGAIAEKAEAKNKMAKFERMSDKATGNRNIAKLERKVRHAN